MKEVIKLGQLLGSSEQRDAVHVAILPCYACEILEPGQRVGIKGGRASSATPHVGVVDPFLPHSVEPGHRFYVMLDPNTITSLRHNWTHPAIEDEVV